MIVVAQVQWARCCSINVSLLYKLSSSSTSSKSWHKRKEIGLTHRHRDIKQTRACVLCQADRRREIKPSYMYNGQNSIMSGWCPFLPATRRSTVWVATFGISLSLTLTLYDAVSLVLRSEIWIPASPTCNNRTRHPQSNTVWCSVISSEIQRSDIRLTNL